MEAEDVKEMLLHDPELSKEENAKLLLLAQTYWKEGMSLLKEEAGYPLIC